MTESSTSRFISVSDFRTENASPAEREYRLRQSVFQQRVSDLKSVDRLFVRFRVFAFLAIIITGAACIAELTFARTWLVLPVAVFFLVLRLHQPIIRRTQQAESALKFYGQCLDRMAGNWRTAVADGRQFAAADHPWSGDLDLFGPGSLFQLLNQCRTLPAQRKLAHWMTSIPDISAVHERQRQTESLRDQLDLRERLAMIDDQVDWGAAEKALNGWLQEPSIPFPAWALWGSRLTGLLSVVVVTLVCGSRMTGSTILLMFLLQIPFYYANRRRIRAVMEGVDSIDQALRQLADVTRQFEAFPLTEKSLQQLQYGLTVDGRRASTRLHELSSLIQWLNNGLRNQFFIPIAWLLGLFTDLPHRIERWRAQYGQHLAEWLETVTTFEVVSSLAAFSYENPEYTLPDVSEDTVRYTAEQIGHPLLPREGCVRNDVSLTAARPLILISGSNMSGKSTLLRSIGINLVLAFCGTRVNAGRLSTYPFQPGTAMRVSDSLQEGRSLFFSVVQRLKKVVDLTAEHRPVLFLLDEILSGTNSHDRRQGAEAVIRTLVRNSALGLVTTHDLTLTQIVESMDGKAVNMHFEDHVENGHMEFDYRLRDGVVQRSNAIELMRMMGLDV
ncbi:MAG: hypothetical protein R3C49_11480 [Planctomycetaceae bacterium]